MTFQRRLLLALVLWLLPTSCLAGDLAPAPPSASLHNGAFDEAASNPSAPPGWGSQGSSYGTARVVERDGASGGHAIELAPGSGGSNDTKSFMLYQVLDAATFKGKKVEYGARVATEGAGVNLVVWSPQGNGNELVSDVSHPEWMERRGTFTLPDDASIVTFGVQVLGPAGSKVFVDDVFVRLAGTAESATALGAPSTPALGTGGGAAQVTIRTGSVLRTLPDDFFAMHIEWTEDGSGMMQPGTGTPRADVVALLKPLHIPMLRFPGGIPADFYDWRKGVGASRGEIRNPFTQKKETVQFGSQEFIAFAKTLGAEGCITANYGTGTAADAGAWAKWFSEQGFAPTCWEVGNEIYLSGPSATGPNSKDIYKPGAQYAKDFPAFASAIQTAIPGAKVGAIAHIDSGVFPLADAGNPNWTREMLSALTAKVDFFALHNGYAPVVIDDSIDLTKEGDRQKLYRAMFAAPFQTKENLVTVANEVKQRSPVNASAPFAITEFSTLVGLSSDPKRHLAYIDHTRTQASALYVASMLDVYMGDPRVMLTMYTNPVHRYYGNLVLADPSGLVTSPTYHLYRFYRDRFEPRIVATETSSPTFSSEQVGLVRPRSDVPTLLTRASTSPDGRRLTALFVNRGTAGALETDVSIEGFTPATVSCQLLSAPLNGINGPSLSDTVSKGSEIVPRPFDCKAAVKQRLSLPPGSIVSLVAEAS